MALGVSIGAGWGRLFQQVLIESLLPVVLASVLGFLFALWAGPTLATFLGTSQHPVRLALEVDCAWSGF
ncbi:MAG: hypothetical protein EHM61_22600 [Acidobacteria bacterium]|nr:MAG: hypothetical protein EHM61_22600 [Acidobacteriota bacterium]